MAQPVHCPDEATVMALPTRMATAFWSDTPATTFENASDLRLGDRSRSA